MSESGTILVVDDLPQNLRLLQAVLEPRGYEVVLAASGEEALDRLGSHPIDLILLDVVMPGLDGFEVCRRVRADENTRFLPLVMITADHGRFSQFNCQKEMNLRCQPTTHHPTRQPLTSSGRQ